MLTSSTELAEDPDFETLAAASLEDLFGRPVQAERDTDAVTVIFGPGAALSRHDELWYFDQPKRYAEAAVGAGAGRNLGQRGTPVIPTTRRLFYVDWPILDRHRDTIAPMVSLWIDAQTAHRPTALEAATLAATAAALVRRPFRTRPMFNTTVWGGHWGQRQLGMGTDQPNSAVGYELIAPESGVLIGSQAELTVEVPFQLLVSLHPLELLGESVHERFGTSFPIRFDYLDTVDGGNLSVHCHPQAQYMREVFGWPYTQHESYYVGNLRRHRPPRPAPQRAARANLPTRTHRVTDPGPRPTRHSHHQLHQHRTPVIPQISLPRSAERQLDRVASVH